MVVLWCLITILIVIFSTSQLISFVASYKKYPDLYKKTTYKKKQLIYFSMLFHSFINIGWIALVSTIEIIRRDWVAIFITAIIMIIITIIVINKNQNDLKDDTKNLTDDDSAFEYIDEETIDELDDLHKAYIAKKAFTEIQNAIMDYLDAKDRYSFSHDVSMLKEAREEIESAFEDFQLDLKGILPDDEIEALTNEFKDIIKNEDKVDRLYAGQTVAFSKKDLVNSAINLQSLKENLTKEEYDRVKKRYEEYQNDPQYEKQEMYSLDRYTRTLMYIQDEFSDIVGRPLNWDGSIN